MEYSTTKDAVSGSKLLCWMITPYPKRPFFHYQIIPMEGKPYGKGVPEFLIGMRDMIDAVFNQMIDRGFAGRVWDCGQRRHCLLHIRFVSRR